MHRIHPARQCAALVLCIGMSVAPGIGAEPPPAKAPHVVFWQDIPSAAFRFEMLPIPGDPDQNIKPFWMSRFEITWEAFDVFLYELDAQLPLPEGVDAITRPSKPYLPPDRGFGHEGYAAISMSYQNAQAFCRWLSVRSGRTYRLPTVAEWRHAAMAGQPITLANDPARLAEHAWFADNAEGKTHPVGRKKPNAWGLHDMLGNVMEWCTDADGKGVAMGGSYRDPAERLDPAVVTPADRAWNASDPQVPKSAWWLADAPFIGFRVVCENP